MHKEKSPKSKAGPERRCIVAGCSFPPEKMIRFVVGPDNQIVPDLDEKLPGRGFWLSAERHMVNTACEKKLFNKAARCSVTVEPDLTDALEAMLARRCLDRVSLARRAGQAIGGYDRVAERLKAGGGKWRGGILLAASDGAADGRKKIKRLADNMDVISLFTSSELGNAIGTERTVHLIIESGGLAKTLRRDARRLAGFRQQDTAQDTAQDTIKNTKN
jgi:hypothetical protein